MLTWRPLIASLSVSLALAPGWAIGEQPVKRQYINLTRFLVRFNLSPPAAGKAPPREVELHASSDSGATWNLVGKAKPSEKGIEFHAPADGEYWFMPRTKFSSGLYLPQGPPIPEMKLVVDTAAPVVDLDAKNDGGGEIVVRWHVADANLKPESFKLEYKAGTANGAWQRISIDRDAASAKGGELRGETAVVLPIAEQSAAIVVRAEAVDAAGNRTIKEQPLSASLADSDSAAKPTSGDEFPPEMPPAFVPAAERDDARPPTPPSYPHTEDWQAEESPSLSNNKDERPSARGQPPQQKLVSLTAKQAVHRLRDLPGAPRIDKPEPDSLSAPPGVQPHLIDKPRFELIYDVDAVGASGIVEVELWITPDCGRTWTSFGLDEDCRSPVAVTVDNEGLYGFRVVVETTAGLRSPIPVAGDLPDVWVEVDVTKPVARLTSAEQGSADEADRLILNWDARDRHLAERGITLRWSDSPQGTWATIASGLENTGRYAWRVDQRVPRQIYLRLEARDEAGNVATDQLSQPVSLDLIRPQGRIREVRPVGAASPAGRRR
jgi:hypothetical protein